jgi:predicted nucleic acid-binding protein
MRSAVVLDAGGLDGTPFSGPTRALVERLLERSGEVWCCAANLAEVCRGRSRTASVEAFLRRGVGVSAVNVRNTDESFAKRVGALLALSGQGSEALADAHVVALCADFDSVVVITTDADDLVALAEFLPSMRMVTRRP